MEYKIVSLYDKAVGAYLRPFPALSVGEAMRAFEDDVANAESPVARHPEDYALFLVGKFNDQTGVLEKEDSPVCLINAHEVVSKLRNVNREQLALFDGALDKANSDGDNINAA